LLLVAVLVGLPVATIRIARERARAEANLIRQYVATGNRLAEQGNFVDALPWFAEALRLEREPDRIAMNRLRLAMSIAECPVPQQLWFHSGQVLAAEFSPDGSKVAVGTSDGTVTIWNLHDGNRAAPALRHGQRIELLKFSPDGRRILTTARGDNEALSKSQPDAASSVRLWDAASGTILLELPHASRVTAACFSRDGAHVATASRHDGVKVWQVDSGAQVLAVPDTTNALDVVWNPDNQALFLCQADGAISRRELGSGRTSWSGKHSAAHIAVNKSAELLLSFGDASTIEVRNAVTGERLHVLKGGDQFITGGFNDAEFSPDGKYVLGSCRDAAATIWALSDGRRVTRVREIQHASVGVFDLTARFSGDGLRVVMGNNAGARVWDATTGIALSPPLTTFTRVRVAMFSPGGEYILTAGADSVCRLWTSGSAVQSRSLLPWPRAMDACAFSPDGQRIVLAGGGMAGFWSAAGTRLSTNLLQKRRGKDDSHDTDYAEFSPDGLKLVSTGQGDAIVWSSASGQPLFPPLRHSTNGDLIARFAPNGRQIITFGEDCAIRFWNAETGREEISSHPIQNGSAFNGFNFGDFTGLQFSPDGTLLLTAGSGPVAQLWKLKSGEPVGPSLLHSAPIQSAAFSKDGHLAATADRDGVARIWRVPSGVEVCPPLKHFGYVARTIFSHDGSRLLTASADRLATVWDVGSGRALLRLLHGDYVNDAAFSPDERLIATASEQGLRLWDARTGEPISSYLPMSAQKAQAWRVKFSPDGRLVLACSQYARNAMLYRLPLAPRAESEWLDLAAIISGQRVLTDGRLESLTPSELAAVWAQARLRAMQSSVSE